jgi:hypothetical protein
MYSGDSRDLYRPIDQKGNYSEGAFGCHRGHMEVLNVRNAQPGFRYYYIRTDASSIQRALRRGWEPCRLDSPERLGEEHFPDLKAAGLDTSLTRNDIVLCRMPESRYREWREQLNKLSDNAEQDGSAEYMEKGRPLQEAFGKEIYFQGPGHGLRRSEH